MSPVAGEAITNWAWIRPSSGRSGVLQNALPIRPRRLIQQDQLVPRPSSPLFYKENIFSLGTVERKQWMTVHTSSSSNKAVITERIIGEGLVEGEAEKSRFIFVSRPKNRGHLLKWTVKAIQKNTSNKLVLSQWPHMKETPRPGEYCAFGRKGRVFFAQLGPLTFGPRHWRSLTPASVYGPLFPFGGSGPEPRGAGRVHGELLMMQGSLVLGAGRTDQGGTVSYTQKRR